jgi:hypothetical protein
MANRADVAMRLVAVEFLFGHGSVPSSLALNKNGSDDSLPLNLGGL